MHLSERLGRRIKLQDLHILMTVVQSGSMGKAAASLNTSQPNISKSIADLEHTLGVRLLDRHRQGVEPTEYGRALLEGGSTVFDELRQTLKNIEFLADPEAGEVRVGSIGPIASSFVSSVVDRITRRHPRMVLNLIIKDTETLHRELRERNVDLLIARKFSSMAEDKVNFEFLFEDSYAVVAGMKNPWARRRRFKLSDLMNESWLLQPPESPPGAIAREAFRASGLDYPRATVIANPADVRMHLLATGRFLTIFSSSTLRFHNGHPELKVLPVELPTARVKIGIITLKGRTLSPVARVFSEYAREVAKDLAGRRP